MLARMLRIEPARDQDLPAMHAYLAAHGDTCMLVRSNLRTAGLRYTGNAFEGEYMLAWHDAVITGVAAHYWNGMLIVQADAAVDALAIALARHSGRPVKGFLGPLEQVRAARAALGLWDARALLDDDETLMALALEDLVVPPALARGELTVRRATTTDRDRLVPWRAAYLVETRTGLAREDAETAAATWFADAMRDDPPWIALHRDEPVAMCAYAARTTDRVQIGAVYTPPALRKRGHARGVVAGALLAARELGVTRAILFTPSPDALAAYRAIGFSPIGPYGVVLLA